MDSNTGWNVPGAPSAIPSEGRCILADYKDSTGSSNVRDHYFGHAAYTRLNAMLFNTTELVQALPSSITRAFIDTPRHPSRSCAVRGSGKYAVKVGMAVRRGGNEFDGLVYTDRRAASG